MWALWLSVVCGNAPILLMENSDWASLELLEQIESLLVPKLFASIDWLNLGDLASKLTDWSVACLWKSNSKSALSSLS